MGKKLWTLAFLLAFAFVAPAQTWQIKAGGGFATQNGDKKWVGAYKFGVGYEYEFNQHWTINPSILLTGKGWKDKDSFVNVKNDETGEWEQNESGELVKSRMHRTTSANYLEIPVLFNYYLRVGESRYVVLGAGPYLACGLWGKQETKGDGRRQGPEKLFYEDHVFDLPNVHRFDAGIQAMVGFQFAKGVTLGVEADLGLSKFYSNGGHNVSTLVSLTYSFKN